jgi:trehalose/maltose transport system substrate-binding protein
VVTVSVMGLGLDSGRQLRHDSLDDFTQATGIQVDLIPTLGSSADQCSQFMRLLKQRASTPDLYLIDVIFPGTLGADLLDLTPYRDSGSYTHLGALLENDTVGGVLVSLPFYLNVGMLYYRKDLLRKYGYSGPPETWRELESMAARIQAGERAAGNRAFWGYVWQGAEYEGLTCNALEWQVSFGGGRVIEPDRRITVNNRRTIEALEEARRWLGTISPPSILAYTESDSLSAFSSGNAAFLRHWSGGFPASRSGDSAVAGLYAMAPLPAGPHGRAQVVGGFHFAVSRYSKHPREAAQLVMYLTGGEVQMRRALNGGYLPTMPALYQSPELAGTLPYVRTLEQAGESAWVARPSTVTGDKYREVSGAYSSAVHDVLSGKSGAERAMAGLEKRLTELTGFRNSPPSN